MTTMRSMEWDSKRRQRTGAVLMGAGVGAVGIGLVMHPHLTGLAKFDQGLKEIDQANSWPLTHWIYFIGMTGIILGSLSFNRLIDRQGAAFSAFVPTLLNVTLALWAISVAWQNTVSILMAHWWALIGSGVGFAGLFVGAAAEFHGVEWVFGTTNIIPLAWFAACTYQLFVTRE